MMSPRQQLLAKLNRVQCDLMSISLGETYEEVVPVVLAACIKHGLTFYFNFLEGSVVLNIVEYLASTEYNELHVRLNYTNMEDQTLSNWKLLVLRNAFLLTTKPTPLEDPTKREVDDHKPDKELHIIQGDKPTPTHIRKAIERIEAKGIPITVESIQNHLPLGQMSTSSRIECNKYLKQMKEASK